jgi:hypothetical protein
MTGITLGQFSHFVDYMIEAMQGRGAMHTQSIYREVERVCDQRGRKLPLEWKSEIRQTLQAHCRGSKQWDGRDDFFVSHRRSYWSCKLTLPQAEVESGAGRGEAISLNSKESFGKGARMPAVKETDVGAAFELVIEALANVQKTINERGAKAFR